jgi:dolichyl-phosphate-mannose--protein O-mannosyl transferase
MPDRSQPSGARGTVERPFSALRLRRVLAVFGIVVCAAGAVILWRLSVPIAIVLIVLGVAAVVDLLVVAARLRRR